jgi:putative membrane protein
MTYKHSFAAAIAAAALFAFMHSPSAQDAKKEGGDDARRASQIAQADLAEIQAGKLGASKGSSDEVKKFAQHMVDDHGKHLDELRTMAKSKKMKLPTAPDKKHQDALKLVQGTAKNAKDADLKADAEKTAKVIQQHLDEAKKIASSLKK